MNKYKSDYADFNERYQTILQCDEKPERALQLDELYQEVYRYCQKSDLTPDVWRLSILMDEIIKAVGAAGEGYPGFQKEVESFYKAINETKQYTPEKRVAALNTIKTNAIGFIGVDSRRAKRLQYVITLIDRLLAEALPDPTGSSSGEKTIPEECLSLAQRVWRKSDNKNEPKPLREWLEKHVANRSDQILKLREINPAIRKTDVAFILNVSMPNISRDWGK